MRKVIFLLLFLGLVCPGWAQTYEDGVMAYRKAYISDLLAEVRHPVSPVQARNISWYAPDKTFAVWAEFKETPGSVPFLLPTHSGKQKPFRQYGALTFMLNGASYTLHVYQSVDLLNDTAHKDDLFLPFTDRTNYETTYGGGRYIDLSIKDIKDGAVLLDFNKCYNPYCAYADGFSCPIPPRENGLPVEIKAGEKVFER